MSGFPVARLGDRTSHGGSVITGSGTHFANGLPVARIGDLVSCPEHGDNPIVVVEATQVTEGLGVAHISARSACGSEIITGASDFVRMASDRPLVAYVHNGQVIVYDDRDVAASRDDDPLPGTQIYRSVRETPAAQSGTIAAEPLATNETEPTPAEEIPTDCEGITEPVPGSFQLSPQFTVAQLSTATAISRTAVCAQHGLTVAQIVCNLKALSENCLEAIAAHYGRGTMIITSGFRAGSSKSQHERGMAADIQFSGISDEEYWNRAQWVKDNVAYDQFILEYLGNRPWLHVSFNKSGCRRQVLTAVSSGTYVGGLQRMR